mgnify:CR=1 FL=1
MRILFSFLLLVGVYSTFSVPVQAGEKVGVILMHGKWGTTKQKSPVVVLGKSLSSSGFVVVTPEMPWSRTRLYDSDYEETMAEIDKAVAKLKSKGATKIVVGGHSMGANAAIGYGARRDGLAAVLAIAPGHVPESSDWKGKFAANVQSAKKNIDAGKGETKIKFTDINQGKKKTLNIPSRVYWSWFAPDGPSPMQLNVKKLNPNAALFWVTGSKDGLHKRSGKSYAYDRAQKNGKSAYVVVNSGHGDAPQKGKSDIIKLLKSL